MSKNGTPIVEGVTTLAVGQEVIWTPDTGEVGTTIAMYVRVDDGTISNGSDISVSAEVKGFTSLADLTAIEGVNTLTDTMTCDDGTGNAGVYVQLVQTDSDTNCSINASDRIDCTPNYKQGQANWSGNYIVECTAGAEVFTQAIAINVTNNNVAPTLTTIAAFTGAYSQVEYEFTHAAILAASNVDDPDGVNSQVQFRVESVTNGALTKDGTAVAEGVTKIGPGQSFKWTSVAATSGDITAFTVVAYDGFDSSTTAINVTTDDMVYFQELADLTVAEGATNTSLALVCTDGTLNGTYSITSETNVNATCSVNGSGQLECSPLYGDDSNDFSNSWTSDLNIRCSVGGQTSDQAITVNITDTNRVPTLTTVTNFTGVISQEAFTISYADLLSAANEADADTTDTLSFRIENVTSGTLTKGGTPVVDGVTLFATGESLVWTSASGTSGNIAAFTIVVSDGTAVSATAISVTMAGVFQFPDIPTLTASEGTLATSSALTCDNGSSTETLTITPAAVDATCSINGSDQIECTPNYIAGQAAWTESITVKCDDGAGNFATKDFILDVSNTNRAPTMTAVTNFVGSQAAEELVITFAQLETNADEADADGDTTFFKINSVTNGTLKKGGITIIPGTTTLVAGEQLEWTPTSTASGDTASFTIRVTDGFADNGSDISVTMTAVLRFDDIVDISTTENVLQSTASLTCDDGSGNANSNFSLVMTDNDANCTLSGATGAPTVGCTPAFKAGHSNWTSDVTVTCLSNGYSKDETFTISVTSDNQAPTLTAITTLASTPKDTDFSISYGALHTASNVADGDGDAIKFRIETLETGAALKINGIAVNVGSSLVSPGDTLTWTPVAASVGEQNAFTVKAYDTDDYSLTAVQVKVYVIDFTDFIDQNVAEGSSANFGTLACADGSASTATFSIVSQTDPEANCTIINPADLGCAPNYKTGQSSWTSDVVVRCTINAITTDQLVVVTANNVNRLPTLTSITSVSPGVDNDGADFIELTYAQILALTDAVDLDLDTISFRIEDGYVANGVVLIDEGSGYGAVTNGVTLIDAGDTIKWTPDASASGDTAAMQLVASDGTGVSITPIDLEINVFIFDVIATLAANEGATSATPTLNCTDGSATTPSYTITNQTDADANCSIISEKVSCTPNFKVTHAAWTSDVTVECTVGAQTFNRTHTIAVSEVNQLPTLTTISTQTGAFSSTVYNIPFATLLAASDAADLDGDTLQFLVKSVNNGSLNVNAAPYAVTTNDILSAGEDFDWTPPTGCNGGDINSFEVVALDSESGESITNIAVQITCAAEPAVLTTVNTTNTYAPTAVGAVSAAFTVNIAYAGEIAATINQVYLSEGFYISAQTCAVIGGNISAACTYDINFNSLADKQGLNTGHFVIEYNDGYADQSSILTTLTATGVNAGDGTFDTLTSTQATGTNPEALATGDFNSDGVDDIVVANYSSGTVSTMLSGAGPTFTVTSIPVGANPQDVAMADINGDGNLDIVVVNRGSDSI
ncbi:VCBS repeat-containing protein, partial [Bacteriovoracaceae bacterium]|nr:VCBS repeat-containing protein [Bacteriovoracaceae bacterium]